MIITQKPRGLAVQTPAKVNLYLEVLRKREDGYHDIETVMDPIDLYDTLEIVPWGDGIALECDTPGVPAGPSNTVALAWEALRRRYPGKMKGMRVKIQKKIPHGGGLGGGSSNAAGLILAADRLFGLGMSTEEMAEAGSEVGSDVPFFFYGGCSVACGRGEKVRRLEKAPKRSYLLVLPGINVPTEKIYKKVTLSLTTAELGGIIICNWEDVEVILHNRLEEAAFCLFPELEKIKKKISAEHDADKIVMSGSGSSIACLCSSMEETLALERRLTARGFTSLISAQSVRY